MEPLLTTLATTVVAEGIKFLYKEAGEVLSAWRKRRQNPTAPPPRLLDPPREVMVGTPRPLPAPADPRMEDALLDLRELTEQIQEGKLDPDSLEARSVLASLRELLETILQAPITFAGEAPRALQVTDVGVTVQAVSGKVAGVRASLEKLQGPADIRGVRVQTGDVQTEGDVAGVDLT